MTLAEPDRTSFVEVNRTRLRLWEWGDEGSPPVVCLHGAYDHGRMFDGLAPDLVRLGYRVVAPDLRGHGDSGRLGSGHAWFAVALDIGALIRHCGSPVGIVGHSFGGGQAAYVAGVWPEAVRWVVNLDGLGPSAGEFDGGDGSADGGADGSDGQADLSAAAARAVAAAERAMFAPPRTYASLDEMLERRRQVNARLPEPWLRHLVEHGARAVEGGFAWKVDPLFSVGLPAEFDIDHLRAEHALARCPFLVLTGAEHDTWSELTEPEVAERVGWLHDARHESIADAGHYVHLEQPEVVGDAIGRFLTDVDSDGAPCP